MKLTDEMIDCESALSLYDNKILHEVLATIEKLNDELEECGIYEKSMYIYYDEHSLSYMIRSVRTDWPISIPTYDAERLMEDANVIKNYILL